MNLFLPHFYLINSYSALISRLSYHFILYIGLSQIIFQLYKYKEQILEAQLKKELAEKRRQEGKLIPQQEEAKRKELLVEQVVF